ncbi:MAG TPA: low affinity iron permease family protein [Burkholderiales bacterium]|nr:low affinity iron permease family protein [Burkholderiales bacterium]
MSKPARQVSSNNAVLPLFDRFATAAARQAGRPIAFAIALGLVIVWALLGPHEDYSDTWQLVINTGTTVITFLMVFLIQHSQNRDAAAVRLKLDELIRAMKGADNLLLGAEAMNDSELERLHVAYENLARSAKERLQRKSAPAQAATAAARVHEPSSPDESVNEANLGGQDRRSHSSANNSARRKHREQHKGKSERKPSK